MNNSKVPSVRILYIMRDTLEHFPGVWCVFSDRLYRWREERGADKVGGGGCPVVKAGEIYCL